MACTAVDTLQTMLKEVVTVVTLNTVNSVYFVCSKYKYIYCIQNNMRAKVSEANNVLYIHIDKLREGVSWSPLFISNTSSYVSMDF